MKIETSDLTTHLKQLLKISNSSEYVTFPYDNPDYFFNPHNFTDSSDDKDDTGAVDITIESESKDEEEKNSHWTKIKVDELRGIGNPMEVTFFDTDSMPDLESISGLEDSAIFILTSPNSTYLTDPDNEERDLTLFSDEKMLDLTEDKGDDGLTSFDAAMLVNIGNVRGIQSKLYDSGALCHMLPY